MAENTAVAFCFVGQFIRHATLTRDVRRFGAARYHAFVASSLQHEEEALFVAERGWNSHRRVAVSCAAEEVKNVRLCSHPARRAGVNASRRGGRAASLLSQRRARQLAEGHSHARLHAILRPHRAHP